MYYYNRESGAPEPQGASPNQVANKNNYANIWGKPMPGDVGYEEWAATQPGAPAAPVTLPDASSSGPPYYYNRTTGMREEKGQSGNQIENNMLVDNFHGFPVPTEENTTPQAPAAPAPGPGPADTGGGGGGGLGPNMSDADLDAYITAQYQQRGRTPTAEDLRTWRTYYHSPEYGSGTGYEYWGSRIGQELDAPGGHTPAEEAGAGAGEDVFTAPPGVEGPVNPEYLAPFDEQWVEPEAYGDYVPLEDFTFEDYQKPEAFQYETFAAPDEATVFNDPGYQFRKDQMQRAIEQSAAARGTLNSGGTIYDLLSNLGSFASQEYGNVYNRAQGDYKTNRDTARATYDTGVQAGKEDWDRGFESAKLGYDSRAQQRRADYDLGQSAWNTNRNNAYNAYTGRKDIFYANQTNPFNKLSTMADLGARSSA